MVDSGVGSPLQVLGREVYTVHDSGVGTSNLALRPVYWPVMYMTVAWKAYIVGF